MAHTPGPWFKFENADCVGGPHPENGTAGIALCGMRLRSPEEVAANIRLIAGAPTMLEALEEAQYALGVARDNAAALNGETCSDAKYFAEQKAIVMDAIRAAKGE